jgi:hypothetical protein
VLSHMLMGLLVYLQMLSQMGNMES